MKSSHLLLSTAIILAGWLPLAKGQTAITLGTASSYALMASSAVSNLGFTSINGDFAVTPGTSLTGFPPGTINGTLHAGDSPAALARTDATTAFNVLAAETFTQNLSGQNLGGLTLTTGVYHFNAAAGLTGILTLDGGNNSSARFDFQIGSTLGTAIGAQVLLINGAQAANVFWQVGSSATFLTSSVMEGTVLAFTSITVGTGTTVDGRLLALNAAVTLDSNTITVPTAIPEPATSAALIAGSLGLIVGLRRIGRRSVR